jgi:hypothetical protein
LQRSERLKGWPSRRSGPSIGRADGPADERGLRSAEVNQINRRKHDDDCGEPEAEHVAHVVSRYSLAGPIFRHHSWMFAVI